MITINARCSDEQRAFCVVTVIRSGPRFNRFFFIDPQGVFYGLWGQVGSEIIAPVEHQAQSQSISRLRVKVRRSGIVALPPYRYVCSAKELEQDA